MYGHGLSLNTISLLVNFQLGIWQYKLIMAAVEVVHTDPRTEYHISHLNLNVVWFQATQTFPFPWLIAEISVGKATFDGDDCYMFGYGWWVMSVRYIRT